jgi:hypothetical protein
MGKYYNVVCGRTDDEADIAEVAYTGENNIKSIIFIATKINNQLIYCNENK